MKAEYLAEPEVEFAGGGRHIDPRFGILNYGPVDRGSERGLKELRVGFVGTQETLDKLTEWMSRCSRGVDGDSDSRQPRLHPRFPGIGESTVFGVNLVLDSRLQRTIQRRFFEPIIKRTPSVEATGDAVTMFLERVKEICEEGPPPHVVVVAPPQDLLDALEANTKSTGEDRELDEGGDTSEAPIASPAFHDLLKARGLSLSVPMQMVRATTYDPTAVRKRKTPTTTSAPPARRLQDEATRAWNFFTALYHKAGGTLWRLSRESADLTTCYVTVIPSPRLTRMASGIPQRRG